MQYRLCLLLLCVFLLPGFYSWTSFGQCLETWFMPGFSFAAVHFVNGIDVLFLFYAGFFFPVHFVNDTPLNRVVLLNKAAPD
jgi:hypothetical protein